MSKTTKKWRKQFVQMSVPKYLLIMTSFWVILGTIIEFTREYFDGNILTRREVMEDLPALAITGLIWSIAMRIFEEYMAKEKTDMV